MATMLIVPVVKIGNVSEHPNASMLGLAQVLGYQVVVGLVEDPNGLVVRNFLKDKVDDKGKRIPVMSGNASMGEAFYTEDVEGNKSVVAPELVEAIRFSFQYKEGDLVVYFPADTILPDELSERLGVKSLLRNGNRVKKIALRGENSFGLVIPVPKDKIGVWQEGDNVASFYGCLKYEPPVSLSCSDAAPYDSDIDPFFSKFTDVQDGRIFVNVFHPNEDVVVSEKLHGGNCRLGFINGHLVAGSMELRRSRPDGSVENNMFWHPWSIPGVFEMLSMLKGMENVKTVELFGEVYGNKIQNGFKYDAGGGLGFKAFGLKVNDRFLDWNTFEKFCMDYRVPVVPVLYKGPFDMQKICALAEGKTTLGEAPLIEGVVVVTARERTDPKIGRAIVKIVGNGYSLLNKRPDSKDR